MSIARHHSRPETLSICHGFSTVVSLLVGSEEASPCLKDFVFLSLKILLAGHVVLLQNMKFTSFFRLMLISKGAVNTYMKELSSFLKPHSFPKQAAFYLEGHSTE